MRCLATGVRPVQEQRHQHDRAAKKGFGAQYQLTKDRPLCSLPVVSCAMGLWHDRSISMSWHTVDCRRAMNALKCNSDVSGTWVQGLLEQCEYAHSEMACSGCGVQSSCGCFQLSRASSGWLHNPIGTQWKGGCERLAVAIFVVALISAQTLCLPGFTQQKSGRFYVCHLSGLESHQPDQVNLLWHSRNLPHWWSLEKIIKLEKIKKSVY